MQIALSILALLNHHLPEIKQALGEQWPAFAAKIQALAPLFENLTDETALTEAVNRQLLGLFMTNQTAAEILCRSEEGDALPGERIYLDKGHKPAQFIQLDTIANRFYLLCRYADRVAEGQSVEEIAALTDPDKSTGLPRPRPANEESRSNQDSGL